MTHIFLSDVHLGAFEHEKNEDPENELIRLIDHCELNEIRLHILGDLFDYWMEFPDFIPDLGRSLLNRFEEYNQKIGGDTTFITGNHDYWTESHFEKRGFRVEHEYVTLKLDDKTLFLCHGDGLSDPKFKLRRPILHRILRNKRFISFFKSIFPGERGLQLMKKFSSFTRDEEYINPDRLNNWAKIMFKTFSFDVIISGHDHVPRLETFPGGLYINTGAFHKHKTLAQYKNGAFELVTWSDRTNNFISFNNFEH